MTPSDPTTPGPGAQITAGLFKLALVLRHQAWQASGQRGLTPTQSQILAFLVGHGPGASVLAVAEHLSITKGTASAAVSTLEKKGLLRKDADPADGRAVRLKLTPSGRGEARRSAQWPEVVLRAIDALPASERGGFLRGLIGLIRALQEQGAVPTSRMCVECRFFDPNRYPGADKPHHCAFLDAAIADADLRIDCPEMEPASEGLPRRLVEALFGGASLDPRDP